MKIKSLLFFLILALMGTSSALGKGEYARDTCPNNMAPGGGGFCVEINPYSLGEVTFGEALQTCQSSGLSLCSRRQWSLSCAYSEANRFLSSEPEWVAEGIAMENSLNCNDVDSGVSQGTPLRFRCCL